MSDVWSGDGISRRPVRGRVPLTDDLRAGLYACRTILTKLQLIDDAPASRRGFAEIPKGAAPHESSIPKGVRMGGDLTSGRSDHAPSKTFSLYAHYYHRMKRAEAAADGLELIKLAGCATRDYEVYTHRRPAYHGSHDGAVDELLRDCRGQSAVEAAWWTGSQVKWVRRHRVLNGYDPETGEPRPKVDDTTRTILALHESGASIRVIASEVNMSKSAVHRILAAGTVSHVA